MSPDPRENAHVQPMIVPSPDCATGKHQACAGDAWDDDLDARVACPCPCHRDVVNVIESL